MLLKFDHVGVIGKSLKAARADLTRILQIAKWTEEVVDPVNGVRLQFGLDASGICYELLEPLSADSPIARAVSDKRAILNHMAYLVDDLAAAGQHMRSARCARTSESRPAIAYGGAHIQFFVTPLNFIIELIEAPGHRHSFIADTFAG